MSFQQLTRALQQMLQFWSRSFIKRFFLVTLVALFVALGIHSVTAQITPSPGRPKVILISLDGATPYIIDQYLSKGVLNPTKGLGLLRSRGVSAVQNLTCSPSLTAACHISIGTGSKTSRTDVVANTFHLVASPFIQTISGFAAPIGGYSTGNGGPAPASNPTAEPIWVRLQEAGKKVVAATFPGADGIDVRVPGLSNSPIIQPSSERTVAYTVPFGAFAGVGGKGFTLSKSSFSDASSTITAQLSAAGKVSYSPVQQASLNDKFTVGGVNYDIQVAAIDTTKDNVTNYDTLVFFDTNQGITAQPLSPPSTGSAYVRASSNTSSRFFLEGSSNKAGTAFYVSYLAPDLSTVRLARYSVNAIPSTPNNPAVQASIDDINNNVGFWANQADFRFPERLNPGIENFPDSEVEAIYEDQVRTFVDYQTRVALRAISQNPNADLAMVYIEQPDGSEHQFLLTDPRQPTDPRNPNSIGAGQDQSKVARYQKYVQTAYRVADNAVQRIIEAVGTDSSGKPNSNIIVVSDHGFAPFHTAVDLNTFLKNNGFDLNKVRAVTSGPAANIYINLQGREPNGTVSQAEYVTLQQTIANLLKKAVDTNPNYTKGGKQALFDKVYSRPLPNNPNDSSFGLGTNEFIGQDSGDVFALLSLGYNFDGTQNPPVPRLGDASANPPVLSVPNFYGAHGYDPTLAKMSAIFFAAGPDIGRGVFPQVRNIDVTPTIDKLLGVDPAPTVQGRALNLKP